MTPFCLPAVVLRRTGTETKRYLSVRSADFPLVLSDSEHDASSKLRKVLMMFRTLLHDAAGNDDTPQRGVKTEII